MIVTNKASSVFAAIEKIAATPGKLEKEQLIKIAGTTSPLFMRVVKAAYDPFITYGMRKVPTKVPGMAPGGNTLDDAWPWEVLDELASRKLSGTAAWEEVQKVVNFLDDGSAELFIRIIRRDLRAGFTDGTINRVFPKTIAEFPYMRCSLPPKSNMPDWDWSLGIISQEKADGMFANVNVDSVGSVNITSRQGTPIPLDHIPDLAAACERTLAAGTQTHGEITVYKDGKILPREEGNGIMNSICSGGELPAGHTLRFDAWDQIPMLAVQPKGKYEVPYKARLAALISQVKAAAQELVTPGGAPITHAGVFVIPTRVVRSKAEAMAHYRELLKLGKEGTICKHPMAIWKDGTSKDQVKLKLEVDVDLEVIEVMPGTPGTKTEGRPGALRCQSSDGLLVVNVTIKNEKMRDDVEAANDAFIGKIFPVRANSIMEADEPDGLSSLFLPRFVEATPRTDKREADSLQQVRDQFLAAVNA
jgi:DNA ligase-1